MSKPLLLRQLQYHIFKGKSPTPGSEGLFDEAYRMWKGIFTDTLIELEGAANLTSDDFIRQDEKTLLTLNGKVIAYLALDRLRLDLKSHTEHSYFKNFPPETLTWLNKEGLREVIGIGNLCVHKDYRRGQFKALISSIIVTLGFLRAKNSGADGCVAITRNNRKVNSLCYDVGCERLAHGITAHNLEAEIVYVRSRDIHNHRSPDVSEMTTVLMENVIVYDASDTTAKRKSV